MRTLWYAGLLLLTGIVLAACQSGDQTVGQSIINPLELVVQTVDTVTIRTSTVLKVDSFATSADNDILVGRWKDAQTGLMTSKAFAALDYAANSFSSQTNLRLDSLVLEMNYSFVYGDTTSLFDMSVHQLKKPLVAQVYYNGNSVDYETTPLLRKVVQPRPNSRGKQIRFRMPDALAQTLFARLLNGQISDYVSLGRLLPGFAFVNNSTNNTLAGFSAAATGSGIRLFYHTIDDPQTSLNLLFPITSLHFSQLLNDRTGTPLSALKTRSDAVNSRLTDNMSYVVPGAFLQTRIEFPYLGQFAAPNGFADLNKALLVIGPVRRNLLDNAPPPGASFGTTAPSPLLLFQTNSQNAAIAVVPEGVNGVLQSNASSASAYYAYDPTAQIFSDSYTFDLTYYISQIIKRKASNEPLLLTVLSPSTGLMKALSQRVALGNAYRTNDEMKLQLYITSGTQR
ncbi:DUF4270 family protein [Spirosoma sp. KNUC1025]|uniref:DUF4270 family protein n=1 Tax=Spirosoma sp. KNUC1025 TaxID=2894082 RepID=UPI003867D140|nr:DUF4270 domain-containing protein [Spirosoma sp. KNUC1025]